MSFQRFLTSNPNFVFMKYERDLNIKNKFLKARKIEY